MMFFIQELTSGVSTLVNTLGNCVSPHTLEPWLRIPTNSHEVPYHDVIRYILIAYVIIDPCLAVPLSEQGAATVTRAGSMVLLATGGTQVSGSTAIGGTQAVR